MKVFIVGEDPVTFTILKKVIYHCSTEFEIISELPARGGQIKSKINEFNTLSATYPVILLTDLDASNCAPELLNKLIGNRKNENFILNIAIDEAEAWLMADREGFSHYFGLKLNDIPESSLIKSGGMTPLIEMCFPYKSSMYLTHEIMNKSSKQEIIKQFTPKKGASKGPEYNNGILPFIIEKWDINNAIQNSDSLNRMVKRLNNLIAKT